MLPVSAGRRLLLHGSSSAVAASRLLPGRWPFDRASPLFRCSVSSNSSVAVSDLVKKKNKKKKKRETGTMTSSGYVAIPRCPVIFDGINYTDFVAHMRIHTRGLGLLGALSGEVPCPPSPVQPVEPSLPVPLTVDPTASQDIVVAAKKADDAAVVAYEQRLSDYKLLAAYTHWMDADARASAVLVSSVLPQFSSEIVGFSSAFQMWTHLSQRYQPSGAALYLSVVRQEHELRQGDATIDEFYSRSSAIWRQLDSLCSTTCGTCACCQTARADKEFQRL